MVKVYGYTKEAEDILENIVTDDLLQMNHVVIPPGKIFPKHPTDANVYILVVKGELSVAIEDGEIVLFKEGQLANVSKGTMSELGNRSSKTVELFVTKIG